MKILFLDIDGVLNSLDNQFAMTYAYKQDHAYKSMDEFGILFDQRCVNWLRYIVLKTECKLVVSSTWRLLGLDFMQKLWSERNLPGEIIDITTSIVPVELYQKYDELMAIRGYEIQAWLDNNTNIKKYCIVDDEVDMLKSQLFVKTSGRYGLTYETAKSIIHVLNS